MTCRKTPYLIELSRKTLITSVSVVLAMIVVLIAGILVTDLPLPLSVLGHEGGTVLVSLNGLRLLAFRGGAD
jgi:Cd2+/Zn2+-exporting ATPase